MDLDILRRGFKLVEYIYDNQAQDLELHRIKDVGNGLAENHWNGKQWLVDELSEFIDNEDIHIAAGWLGLTGYLLRKEFPKNKIVSSDFDPGCKVMGKFLFDDYDIEYRTLDTVLAIEQIREECQVYINTSTEHIKHEYMKTILKSLKSGTVVALQSNNYYSVDDHINCCDNLQHFVDKTPVRELLYSGEMPFKNYDRYMVIGMI